MTSARKGDDVAAADHRLPAGTSVLRGEIPFWLSGIPVLIASGIVHNCMVRHHNYTRRAGPEDEKQANSWLNSLISGNFPWRPVRTRLRTPP